MRGKKKHAAASSESLQLRSHMREAIRSCTAGLWQTRGEAAAAAGAGHGELATCMAGEAAAQAEAAAAAAAALAENALLKTALDARGEEETEKRRETSSEDGHAFACDLIYCPSSPARSATTEHSGISFMSEYDLAADPPSLPSSLHSPVRGSPPPPSLPSSSSSSASRSPNAADGELSTCTCVMLRRLFRDTYEICFHSSHGCISHGCTHVPSACTRASRPDRLART